MSSQRFIALGTAHGVHSTVPSSIKEAAQALTDAGIQPNAARRLEYSVHNTHASGPRSTASSPGAGIGDIPDGPAPKRIKLSKAKSAVAVTAPTSDQLAQNGAGESRWREVGGPNQHFLWREEVLDGWTDHQGRPFQSQTDEETGELTQLPTVCPHRGSPEQAAKRQDLLAKLVHNSGANPCGTWGLQASAHRDFHIGRPESHLCRPGHRFQAARKKSLSPENKLRVGNLEDSIEALDGYIARQALILHETLEVIDDHANELAAIAIIVAKCTRAADIKSAVGAILGTDCTSAENTDHLQVDSYHRGLGELIETAIAKGNIGAVELQCQQKSRVRTTLASLLVKPVGEAHLAELSQANFGLLQDDQRTACRAALKIVAPTIPSAPTAAKRPDMAPQELALAKAAIDQEKALEGAIRSSDSELSRLREKLRCAEIQLKRRKAKPHGRPRHQQPRRQPAGDAAPAGEPEEPTEADGAGRGRGGRDRGG